MTAPRDHEAQPAQLPTRTVAVYGAAAGVFEMLRAPGLAILPSLYAKDYQFPLTTISVAMLWLRLSDMVMDPAVGYLSDRTRSRWGPRKPWMFASILVLVPACFILYSPGAHPTMWQFVVGYFFYYLGWAMFDIPYTAWGTEVATSYASRSRLSIARGLFANIGLLLITLIPLLPWLPSTAMTFQVTSLIAGLLVFLYPAVILWVLTVVPAGTARPDSTSVNLRETLRAVRGNRPLLLFLGMATMTDLGMGISSAMFFMFFDSYLGIGNSFALVFLTSIAASTLSLRAWQIVVNRTSKRMLLQWCTIIGVVQGVMVLWIDPGPWALPLFICFMALLYIAMTGRDVAMYAMIGDIVDFDTLKNGGQRAGQLTSAWMVLRKLCYALGPVIGLYVAGAMGYDPGAKHNGAMAIFGLKAANGYLPALLLVFAALLVALYPLTPERYEVIRRRLEQRAARTAGLGRARRAA